MRQSGMNLENVSTLRSSDTNVFANTSQVTSLFSQEKRARRYFSMTQRGVLLSPSLFSLSHFLSTHNLIRKSRLRARVRLTSVRSERSCEERVVYVVDWRSRTPSRLQQFRRFHESHSRMSRRQSRTQRDGRTGRDFLSFSFTKEKWSSRIYDEPTNRWRRSRLSNCCDYRSRNRRESDNFAVPRFEAHNLTSLFCPDFAEARRNENDISEMTIFARGSGVLLFIVRLH